MLFILIIISMLILIFKLLTVKKIHDRVLISNALNTNVIAIIALIAYDTDTASLIDIALIYACVSFISTIAFLRFYGYKSL